MKGLSKSRILAGHQCLRRLWWSAHEPDAPELIPSVARQAIFDNGHRVGAAAVDDVPGGIMIEDNTDRGQMVRDTQQAIDDGATIIYEASFTHERVFVAIDILERSENGWTIIEVKSTASVKPHHHLDAAVQAWVAGANGIDVTRVELMHLNSSFDGSPGETLFLRSDITGAALKRVDEVTALAPELREALNGDLPEVAVGPHCRKPYECEFIDRCQPKRSPDHIDRLFRVKKAVLGQIRDLGIERISEIPPDIQLPAVASRQREALIGDCTAIDPGLIAALDTIKYPALFLDFEAINNPLPPWEGCRPYEQVPVQVSMHLVDRDGSVTHNEWLAEGPDDPRPDLARVVLDAVDQANTLVAYFAAFEQRMFRALAAFLPPLDGARLIRKCDDFIDLLPLVRNHVYHPNFEGRFSLKKVLPALIPALAYDDLTIQGGSAASAQLASYIVSQEPPDGPERTALRNDLLAYCERDTIALVRLTEVLRKIGESA